jgi:hypothetical protein
MNCSLDSLPSDSQLLGHAVPRSKLSISQRVITITITITSIITQSTKEHRRYYFFACACVCAMK